MDEHRIVHIARRVGWITLAVGVGCFLVDPLVSLLIWGIGGLPLDVNLYRWQYGVVAFISVVSSIGTWLISAAVVLLIVVRVTRTTPPADATVDPVGDEELHA